MQREFRSPAVKKARDSVVTKGSKGSSSTRSFKAEYMHIRSDEKNYISLTLKELKRPELAYI